MIAHGPVEQFFFLSQPVEAEPEIFFLSIVWYGLVMDTRSCESQKRSH